MSKCVGKVPESWSVADKPLWGIPSPHHFTSVFRQAKPAFRKKPLV